MNQQEEVLSILENNFKNEKWFHNTGLDQHGRCVVYAHWIDLNVQHAVPHVLNGNRVLLHFAANKKACRDKYVNNLNNKPKLLPKLEKEPEEEYFDLDELIANLDVLEMTCGANILESIFFEEHDKHNTVTNLSIRFPEVRKTIHELYEKFGFDILYDQLNK